MPLRIYNTLTREKEPFDKQPGEAVGMYLCGPTVYKPPHIGHMVGPVIFDAIKRFLTHKGYRVTWVVNITDVEDKLIAAAQARNTSVESLARKYEGEYKDVLAALGVDTIDQFPRATDHIGDILDLCRRLIERGHAYASDGNVWFDVTSDEDYGKLSRRRAEDQAGDRELEGSGKKNPQDFALWKAAKPGEPAWDSPWGRGRPGWHIECSAMSTKLLGDTFDIHGGGMDLLFPHHENELAQSESATGQPFARFWLHNGLTRLRTKAASGEWKDEKMSGSLGNVISAAELVEKHGADALRYLILSSHYRSPIDFEDSVLAASKKGLGTFTRLFERIERLKIAPLAVAVSGDGTFSRAVRDYRQAFEDAMDDDFNTAGALAAMHELANEINAHIERTHLEQTPDVTVQHAIAAATGTLKELGEILGLFRVHEAREATDDLAPKLMELLISLRADARKNRNFQLADSIRQGLAAAGVTLEDTPQGTIWRRD